MEVLVTVSSLTPSADWRCWVSFMRLSDRTLCLTALGGLDAASDTLREECFLIIRMGYAATLLNTERLLEASFASASEMRSLGSAIPRGGSCNRSDAIEG